MRASKRPSSTSAARPSISRRAPGSTLPSRTSGRRGLAAAGRSSLIDGGVVSTVKLQPRVVSGAQEAASSLDLHSMLPVLKRTGAKRLGRALACRAGGDVAAVELPPHVARAGNAELELRQSGRIHVRATGGARRVQRRREDAACARNRRREERDRSNRCKRDDTAPADRRSRDARTPGPSFLSLCRDNRLLLLVRGGRLLLLDRALKSARLGSVFEQGDDRSSRGSLRCGRAATCCGPRPFQGGGPIFGAHSVLGGGERGRRRGPRLGRQPLATLRRPMPNLLQMGWIHSGRVEPNGSGRGI